MIDCKEVCKNKYMNIPVCEIYENMHTNYVHESVEEMDSIQYTIFCQDYNDMHDWVIYSALHGLDCYDLDAYESVSCEEYYYDFMARYWKMHDKKESRVKWLAGLIVKFKEPYYTERGDYEQIVIIPEFRKFGYRFDADKYCISYRVNAERFFE